MCLYTEDLYAIMFPMLPIVKCIFKPSNSAPCEDFLYMYVNHAFVCWKKKDVFIPAYCTLLCVNKLVFKEKNVYMNICFVLISVLISYVCSVNCEGYS